MTAVEAVAGDLRPGDHVTAYFRMNKWKKIDFVVGKVEGDLPNLVFTAEGQSFDYYHFMSTVRVQIERPGRGVTGSQKH